MDMIDVVTDERIGVRFEPLPVITALAIDHMDAAATGQVKSEDDEDHPSGLSTAWHTSHDNPRGVGEGQCRVGAVRKFAHADPAGYWVKRPKPEL